MEMGKHNHTWRKATTKKDVKKRPCLGNDCEKLIETDTNNRLCKRCRVLVNRNE